MWAMFLHLSQLLGFLVPFAGLVAPILIWQLKKAEMPELDVHGKNVVNWLISYMIYIVVSVVLIVAFVGFFLIPVVIITGAVFAVIGGVKANNGEVWEYPLAIRFIS
jgi:uncharacterized Tic20 family protein